MRWKKQIKIEPYYGFLWITGIYQRIFNGIFSEKFLRFIGRRDANSLYKFDGCTDW